MDTQSVCSSKPPISAVHNETLPTTQGVQQPQPYGCGYITTVGGFPTTVAGFPTPAFSTPAFMPQFVPEGATLEFTHVVEAPKVKTASAPTKASTKVKASAKVKAAVNAPVDDGADEEAQLMKKLVEIQTRKRIQELQLKIAALEEQETAPKAAVERKPVAKTAVERKPAATATAKERKPVEKSADERTRERFANLYRQNTTGQLPNGKVVKPKMVTTYNENGEFARMLWLENPDGGDPFKVSKGAMVHPNYCARDIHAAMNVYTVLRGQRCCAENCDRIHIDAHNGQRLKCLAKIQARIAADRSNGVLSDLHYDGRDEDEEQEQEEELDEEELEEGC